MIDERLTLALHSEDPNSEAEVKRRSRPYTDDFRQLRRDTPAIPALM